MDSSFLTSVVRYGTLAKNSNYRAIVTVACCLTIQFNSYSSGALEVAIQRASIPDQNNTRVALRIVVNLLSFVGAGVLFRYLNVQLGLVFSSLLTVLNLIVYVSIYSGRSTFIDLLLLVDIASAMTTVAIISLVIDIWKDTKLTIIQLVFSCMANAVVSEYFRGKTISKNYRDHKEGDLVTIGSMLVPAVLYLVANAALAIANSVLLRREGYQAGPIMMEQAYPETVASATGHLPVPQNRILPDNVTLAMGIVSFFVFGAVERSFADIIPFTVKDFEDWTRVYEAQVWISPAAGAVALVLSMYVKPETQMMSHLSLATVATLLPIILPSETAVLICFCAIFALGNAGLRSCLLYFIEKKHHLTSIPISLFLAAHYAGWILAFFKLTVGRDMSMTLYLCINAIAICFVSGFIESFIKNRF